MRPAGQTSRGEIFLGALMFNYRIFYSGKQVDLKADSQYAAKLAGAKHFNVPKAKQHMITPVLIDTTHSTSQF